jgi:single-stranded-DNA-specific exonuclease
MILSGSRYGWRLESVEPGLVSDISRAVGVSEPFARVLAARGVGSADDAVRYLGALDDPLPDAHLLPDADRVVERVRSALGSGELIAVHGHDDADGVTATTVMMEALDQLGASVVSYIPDRKTEGHGLTRAELDRLHGAGVSLIITVDSCVSDREFISYGNGLGIDTIVTDHPEIPPELPPAVAIVDPKLPDSRFPYKYMAGVGVALRVADLLMDDLGGEFGPARENVPWYGPRWRQESLALVAIGSIADKVPLTGDNRSLVTQGLAAAPGTNRVGLRVALEEGRLWGRELSPEDVRDSLGRLMGRAPGDSPGTQRALDLLAMRDPDEARSLAASLFERQQRWRESAVAAWRTVREDFDGDGAAASSPVIILETEVPIGTAGYVTSRLTEETGRPVIMVGRRNSEVMGEARGPVGFNFVEAFATMRELFIGYGGHPRAAGFSMAPSEVPRFKERMDDFVRSNPPSPDPRRIDTELRLEETTPELGRELELMQPFGQGSRRAVFLARRVTSATLSALEAKGVRFGTPVRIGRTPTDVVFRLRNSEGVALISILDSIVPDTSGG